MASDLMLLSNSFSPGLGPLEHAMDALAELLAGCQRVLFVGYASSEPDAYTDVMRTILCGLGPSIVAAHRSLDPCRALAAADAVFVGGGNAFRLLRAVQRNGLLAAIQDHVPVLGLREGAWLCVSDSRAELGGTAAGRLFFRGRQPHDVGPGDDVTDLLQVRPAYDSPLSR